jgi:tryptophan 2,3-dioxygenase
MAEVPSVQRMTYGGYLRLDELLQLQDGPEGHLPAPCNNERHFIIVHQAFELWFKLVLSELKQAHLMLNATNIDEKSMPKLVHHLERVTSIFTLMAQQWKVMETLAPQEFLDFRDRLGTSSGFESWQMREMEALLGLEHEQRAGGMNPLQHMRALSKEGKISKSVLDDFEQTSSQPSIKDALQDWLSRTPINGSISSDKNDLNIVTEFVDNHIVAMKDHSELVISHIVEIGHGKESQVRPRMEASIEQAEQFLKPDGVVNRSRAGLLFIESYRDLPLLAWPRLLIDSFVELEQSMLLFRNSHARMVERMIGRRMGTGGSSGVDYLDATLKYRIFVDLWAENLPDIKNQEYYGFNTNN